MILGKKREKLRSIYEAFDTAVREFRTHAVCEKGCNFCCTCMGNIDIVTLEGAIIHDRLKEMAKEVRRQIADRTVQNRIEKAQGKKPPCPFQDDRGACHIYEVRPFSCRQLYSLRKCDDAGPLVHKQAAAVSRETVKKIQTLDETGYSGHISFILHLLDVAEFRETYLAGGFDPAMIANFGKTHGIFINRFAR